MPVNPQKFFVDLPLYEKAAIEADADIWGLAKYVGSIDCFCIYCKEHSVFIGVEGLTNINLMSDDYPNGSIFVKKFVCSRKQTHVYWVAFLKYGKSSILKIGQFPSLADVVNPELDKYKKVLGEKLQEFKRGVGLAAHGVNIGSFAYLRRIFEKLIEDARQDAEKAGGFDNEKFAKVRWEEKVEMVLAFLPDRFNEFKPVYSLLSKGIHQLTEDECGLAFPALKAAIELILDEKLEKMNKEKKFKEVQSAMGALSQKHSKTEIKPK
jgi:hypothetical protein